MKQLMSSCALAFSLLVAAHTSEAAVWKVEKNDQHIYVGGTIHMLATTDYPLPIAYETAYENADELWFETDIAGLTDPQVQMRMMQQLMYPQGESLADDVSKETLANLARYLEARGLPASQFMQMKPGLLAVTIAAIELQMMGVEHVGIDAHFSQRAGKDAKPVSWFESVDYQMGIIGAAAEGDQDAYLQYTLDTAAETREIFDAIRRYWRQGDLEAIEADIGAPMAAETPQAYEVMISRRNQEWLPKIEALFEDPDTELVLVGMLHLAGDAGVLAKLEQRGYTVTPLQ
jgi:uncharacterized protein YbaP (TraB family)